MRRPWIDYILSELRHPNFITRLLYKLIPLSLQRAIRDSGTARLLADTATTIMAGLYAMAHPRLAIDFVRLRNKQQLYYYGESISPRKYLQVMRNEGISKADTSGQRSDKVLIFIHGGAWGSGKPWMYQNSVHGLAQSIGASVAILVGYPLYPESSIEQQADCVVEAVDYIKDNIIKIDSSFEPISDKAYVLAGHSSGANIAALACLESAQSGRKLVDLFIGLAGVYDLHNHHWYEENRGVHEVSPMTAAAGGFIGLPAVSPTTQFRRHIPFASNSQEKDLRQKPQGSNSLSLYYPLCFLLHGRSDTTVPVNSTMEFESVLQDCNIPVKAIYSEVDHIEPIFHLLSSSSETSSSTHEAFHAAMEWFDNFSAV